MKHPEKSLPPCVSGCCPPERIPDAETFARLQQNPLPETLSWQALHPLQEAPRFTYGIAQLQYGQQVLDIAVHKWYSLFAPVRVEWRQEQPRALAFRNWQTQEREAFGTAFTLLEPDWLIQKPDPDIPVSQLLLRDLDDEEFARFSFFQPENIGEIVFNDWAK